jgi:hypothetical protein
MYYYSSSALLLLFSMMIAAASSTTLNYPDNNNNYPPAEVINPTTTITTTTTLPQHENNNQRVSDIVNMQKTMYSVLGQYQVPEIVSRFQPEFKRLDTDGTLSNTLDMLYEMRLLDMQISIQHAKKMRSVLDVIKRSEESVVHDR